VQVVVVVREPLHDARRAGEREARAHEDPLRAGGDEAVDEVLRELDVDLGRPPRRPLGAVAARVVDVDVEPILVRDVADATEARPEVAAARPAEVADADPRRARVRGREVAQDAEHRPHEPVAPPPPPGAVG
jgi:hypothetical protein